MFAGSQVWQGVQVLFTVLFLLLILIYPRYLFYRMVADMEEVAERLEGYAKEAAELAVNMCGVKGEKTLTKVRRTFDFFLIPPVDLDPYGILRKLEHLLDGAEERFWRVAEELAPECDRVVRANLVGVLKGGTGINMLAKLVRHHVELVKKTKNLQLAMVFQMNLPIIKRIGRAQMEGVRAIARGEPIGDGVGPLVAARLMRNSWKEVARDVVYSEEVLEGRRVLVVKARGPGACLGKLGDAVKKLCEWYSVGRIITVDASLKMEGEPTGRVSEGMGAAIGDPGPEKAKIEECAVSLGIPLEAVAVKMSIEEAISPMLREIRDASDAALQAVREAVRRTPPERWSLLVGVGNTCGIGNSSTEVEEIKVVERKEEREEQTPVDRFVKWLVERQKRAEREMEEKRREQEG